MRIRRFREEQARFKELDDSKYPCVPLAANSHRRRVKGMKTAMADSLQKYSLYIAGQKVEATSGRRLLSVDPTRGEPWAVVEEAGERDVDRAVGAAALAFESPAWQGLSPTRRGRTLMRFADRLAENGERLARIETRDNGKLFREMRRQLEVVPEWLYYFGGLADKIEGRVIPLERQSVLNYTERTPLGVIGAIVPWNSPLLITAMMVAPALAAGNTVVVKPSEHAAASILEAAVLAEEAGLPPGVFNVVTGGPSVGETLVRHHKVAKVAFTGGSETGAKIASLAGSRLVSALLELGGKSANIVFADADQDAAEAGVLAGIFAAGGQTCVAGSRVLVERSVYEEFVDRLVKRAESIRVGDPMDEATQMGPIATPQQLKRIEGFVESAAEEGAVILAGGTRENVAGLENGFFYRPTIVGGSDPASRIGQEEVFGPVMVITSFETEDEAVALANGTRYGLAAGLWTNNVRRAHRVARRLQAGTVWVNTYRAIAFNSPFGGYKASGLGRENGREAIYEFLQTKSVWCELSDEIQDPFTVKV